MIALDTRNANQSFAKVTQASAKALVYIEENKKNIAVVMSAKRYKELENYMLLKIADKLYKEGDYCTAEEGAKRLR